MNKLASKKPLWLMLGLGAAVTLPIAVAISCGETSASEQLDANEEQTIAAIVAAPDTPTPGSDALLSDLKRLTSPKVVAGTNLVSYLRANKPGVLTYNEYVEVFLNQVRSAWKLPQGAFVKADFDAIIAAFGITSEAFTRSFNDYLANYDAKNTNGLATWTSYVALWRYAFDSTNNYGNTQALLARLGFAPHNVLNLDHILSTPVNVPSGVKRQAEENILGEGGTSILPVPDVTPLERAARDAIATPGNDTLLQDINLMISTLGDAQTPRISARLYLDRNAPGVLKVEDFAPLIVEAVSIAWALPATPEPTFARLEALFAQLNISIDRLAIDLPKRLMETMGNAPDYWRAYTETLRNILTPDDEYLALRNYFTAGMSPLFSQEEFGNFDAVMAAGLNVDSNLRDLQGQAILGWGGRSLLPQSLEAAAQASLVNPPADDEVLLTIQGALNRLFPGIPDPDLATYLATNAPDTLVLDDYVTVLATLISDAWQIPAEANFGGAELKNLLIAIGINFADFNTWVLPPQISNLTRTVVLSNTWDSFIRYWRAMFDPAGEYAYLLSFLKLTNNALLTEEQTSNLDFILATPLGEPSNVSDVNTGAFINGWGGKLLD